jgi:hypothetical protein
MNIHITSIDLFVELTMGPFWAYFPNNRIPANYLAEDISEVITLSDDLLEAITAWDSRYQSTYVDHDPASSGIKNPEERAAFNAVGEELARRLRAELPAAITVQYSEIGGNLVTIEQGSQP